MVEFVCETLQSGTSVCWKFFAYWFNFNMNNWSVQIISSWFSFGRVYISINLSISSMWLSSKESACSIGATGNMGLIPGSGRSCGVGHGDPLQYSCLENSLDREAWRVTVISSSVFNLLAWNCNILLWLVVSLWHWL